MPMLKDPSAKYKAFCPPEFESRTWPSRTLKKPPRWLATDLRDGNQSLPVPMDMERKWKYFKMLIALGYKEIEVACPTATQADYDFTRRVVESPESNDIWIQALSACVEEMILKTVQSLKGARKAILHLYMATSKCFQRIVFGLTNEESLALVMRCTKYARSITKDDPSNHTQWTFQFCPEAFSDSSPEFAVQEPSEDNPVIFNLTATVEVSTPNVYADQVEYFCTHIADRHKVCVSLHTHNDRGCAVAGAELGQLAGADRVEGVLFGNGERTGNADLVTLGLNFYTQGVHPGIDFSDISAVVQIVEMCNRLPVHHRSPYGGELVVSAFGASYQDAIAKGFEARKVAGPSPREKWEAPYLPFDPEDIGRSYVPVAVNDPGKAQMIATSTDIERDEQLMEGLRNAIEKKSEQMRRELTVDEIKQHVKTY